jgi:hypothetical protein
MGPPANVRPRLEYRNPAPSNFYPGSKSKRGLLLLPGLLSSRFVDRAIWLFPTKHFGGERYASEKHQGQRRHVADVRGPRVTSPNPFE